MDDKGEEGGQLYIHDIRRGLSSRSRYEGEIIIHSLKVFLAPRNVMGPTTIPILPTCKLYLILSGMPFSVLLTMARVVAFPWKPKNEVELYYGM